MGNLFSKCTSAQEAWHQRHHHHHPRSTLLVPITRTVKAVKGGEVGINVEKIKKRTNKTTL